MKTMKFNSQICTTREQSERLLALGLKKETADFPVWGTEGLLYMGWSLHRLIEMLALVPYEIYPKDNVYNEVIDDIEEAINEGYFNKEYLV